MSDPRWGLICCICFSPLTPETCAIDEAGVKWDVCSGRCATEAGITERAPASELGEDTP